MVDVLSEVLDVAAVGQCCSPSTSLQLPGVTPYRFGRLFAFE